MCRVGRGAFRFIYSSFLEVCRNIDKNAVYTKAKNQYNISTFLNYYIQTCKKLSNVFSKPSKQGMCFLSANMEKNMQMLLIMIINVKKAWSSARDMGQFK